MESNEATIDQREREINQIAKSIHQLAEIFRDLQTLVIDQGTMLDRIDYNIEQSAIQLKEATVQLDKVCKCSKMHTVLIETHRLSPGCTISKQDSTSKTDTIAYFDYLLTCNDSYRQSHKVMIPSSSVSILSHALPIRPVNFLARQYHRAPKNIDNFIIAYYSSKLLHCVH